MCVSSKIGGTIGNGNGEMSPNFQRLQTLITILTLISSIVTITTITIMKLVLGAANYASDDVDIVIDI